MEKNKDSPEVFATQESHTLTDGGMRKKIVKLSLSLFNKLHHKQDTFGEWPLFYRKEVIFTVISHWSHSHYSLLKMQNIPIWLNVQGTLTVKYILLNCNSFRHTHPKYYQTISLKDLFKNTKPEDILSFLKETYLFIKI